MRKMFYSHEINHNKQDKNPSTPRVCPNRCSLINILWNISTSGNYLLLNVLNSRQPSLEPDFRRNCRREEGSNRASWGPLVSCQVLAEWYVHGAGRMGEVSRDGLPALLRLLTA